MNAVDHHFLLGRDRVHVRWILYGDDTSSETVNVQSRNDIYIRFNIRFNEKETSHQSQRRAHTKTRIGAIVVQYR